MALVPHGPLCAGAACVPGCRSGIDCFLGTRFVLFQWQWFFSGNLLPCLDLLSEGHNCDKYIMGYPTNQTS